MNVYAESSAILGWLLEESSAPAVRDLLVAAEHIVASDLTLIECDRALRRALAVGALSEAECADKRALLQSTSSHWHTLRIAGEVVDRARQPFSGDPIRTPDAIHLASAIVARGALAGLKILSLDERIRAVGRRMGVEVVP